MLLYVHIIIITYAVQLCCTFSLPCTWLCVCVDIIPMWQPGVQGDAHEVMMGILNSRSALVVHIPNVIQFQMVTTGKYKFEYFV